MQNLSTKTTVIIPAAGTGRRLGASVPKQYMVLKGSPIIIYTLAIFDSIPEIVNIIISINFEWESFIREAIAESGLKKPVYFSKGGAERQQSVHNALKDEYISDSDLVLIHDSVRPFTSVGLVERIIGETSKHGAAIPGLTPNETIKTADSNSYVGSTLNRAELVSVQTPQGFRREIIIDSYEKASKEGIIATDDASLVEYAGYPVKIIPGEDTNIKITTMIDLQVAAYFDLKKT